MTARRGQEGIAVFLEKRKAKFTERLREHCGSRPLTHTPARSGADEWTTIARWLRIVRAVTWRSVAT